MSAGLDGRRRAAPLAEETSDERRFVGVGLAAVFGAVATLGALMATIEPRSLQAPGPLSRPHVQAQLSCTSCHTESAPPGQACEGCHGPHPSTRGGHRAMAEQGKLRCTSCHRIHRDMGGVALATDGDPVRFGPGAEVVVPADGPAVGGGPWVVPVIPAEVCARCHAVDDDADPIRRCLLTGQEGVAVAERPTACFDEHRRLDGLTITDAATRRRLSAHGVARQVVARSAVAPSERPEPPPAWIWLAWGGLAAVVAWALARGVARLRRPRRAATMAAPPTAAAVPEVKRLPVVDATTCIGCYACVDACPYDVLAIEQYVARVVRPDDCCGLILCEQRCPNGSLVVTEGEPITDRPAIDGALMSQHVPGLYLAGDLTGMPLIRNAINQGATAVESIAASLTGVRHGADLDLVIVGAGPAGISAALAASKARLRYVVVEQGSVAESIRSFPRGKLVFDQPLGLPMVGDLWLAEATKEELVGKWLRIVRQQSLPVHEGSRVVAVDRDAAGTFVVRAQTEAGPRAWSAPRVLLAIGRRGTPRKLPIPIPDSALSRVCYGMADARSFAGQRVVIVGLGDVAMEAAVALSRQTGTTVTIVYRGETFTRGKQRNIDELQRRVAAGRVELRWRTELIAVTEHTLTLTSSTGPETLPYDALMVMIGAIAPWDFLHRTGIHRVGE